MALLQVKDYTPVNNQRQQPNIAAARPLARGVVVAYLWRWAGLLPHSRGFMAA